MKLFDLIDNKVVISEEAYLLKPFKVIWDRDKTKTKEKALAELAYVYFMEDYKSDFSDIVDEEERKQEVVASLMLPSGWQEDEVVSGARLFYRKRSEEILPLLLLKSSKKVLDDLRRYFKDIDFAATDSSGKPKYDIDKVTKVVARSSQLLENLEKLEEQVKKAVQAKSDMVGSKQKAVFEDGI